MFDCVNVMLQSDSPKIHVLLPALQELLKDLLAKFVKPELLVNDVDIAGIDYKSANNHRQDIYIGSRVKQFIAEQGEKKFDLKTFNQNVLQFYIGAVKNFLLKLPFSSKLLKHLQVADVSKKQIIKNESVEYRVNTFPCLQKKVEIVELEAEVLRFQSFNIPQDIWEMEIDTAWYKIAQIKNVSDKFMFANFAKVILYCLTIYHSNACCERKFSVVGKNMNEYRSNMSVATLNHLLLRKTGKCGSCFEQKYSDNFMKSARSATYKANHL